MSRGPFRLAGIAAALGAILGVRALALRYCAALLISAAGMLLAPKIFVEQSDKLLAE